MGRVSILAGDFAQGGLGVVADDSMDDEVALDELEEFWVGEGLWRINVIIPEEDQKRDHTQNH